MELFRTIFKTIFLIVGLVAIFLLLSRVITTASDSTQSFRDNEASASILQYNVSDVPFGHSITSVEKGKQYYWNMNIIRTLGEPCFVTTSWRWSMETKVGWTVMWNSTDGEFFVGDQNEHLSQAFTVPLNLLPGIYTFTRYSKYKCGNDAEFSSNVRTINLIVR